MIPLRPLPLADEWQDPESYIAALLGFATTSTHFRNFAGGIHILDFLTREPDLYTTVVPEDWRLFFDYHDINTILDLLLREDIAPLRRAVNLDNPISGTANGDHDVPQSWRGAPLPPASLLQYIHDVRRLTMRRDYPLSGTTTSGQTADIPPHVAVGMRPKKRHEVEHFAHYVHELVDEVQVQRKEELTHIVDFGSGQNYLGRTLASPPYNRSIIAIERRHHNISGALDKDVQAKLKAKHVHNKNKKLEQERKQKANGTLPVDAGECETCVDGKNEEIANGNGIASSADGPGLDQGKVEYIEHDIQDGYLEPIIKDVVHGESSRAMVVSLHSCGNLVHHGIRSLIMNPSVVAIAMIGCCYNLMTERLGPVTYKLPILRSLHPRLDATSNARDPHGFPMSKYMEEFPHEGGTGIKINITARMMAVQAPQNWGPQDSRGFFTRHFYRALLQRLLVDYRILPPSPVRAHADAPDPPDSPPPLIVGSVRKSSTATFPLYARAAIKRLAEDPYHGAAIRERLLGGDGSGGITEDELENYVQRYDHVKKTLSIAWTLMAFSATVVESIIMADRWLFLREQLGEKGVAWVETAFCYAESPRNLVVVGVKR